MTKVCRHLFCSLGLAEKQTQNSRQYVASVGICRAGVAGSVFTQKSELDLEFVLVRCGLAERQKDNTPGRRKHEVEHRSCCSGPDCRVDM